MHYLKSASRTRRRPRQSVRRADIISDLRAHIVRGSFAPGDRLPTRDELVGHFGASKHTVQAALDRLLRDGFVRARRGGGTFVTDSPPHLADVAIVYPCGTGESLLYDSIRSIASPVTATRGLRAKEYICTSLAPGMQELQRLCDDVKNHRLAAIVFASAPHLIAGSDATDRPGIPRAAIEWLNPKGPPSVWVDLPAFRRRAVDYLHERGRSRIGHVAFDGPNNPPNYLRSVLIEDLDLEVRPYWVQLAGHGGPPRAVIPAVHAMMELSGDKRPDALIVHDDNLLEPALAALLAAGVRVPDDVDIVTHANFPSRAPGMLPVRRLGFDTRLLLGKCLELIEQQRRGGKKPPRQSYVAPQWEEELGAAAAAVAR